LFGLGSHISSRKPESSDPDGIKPSGHLANVVSAALQRENPTRDKCAHNIISAEVGVPLKLLDIPDNLVGFVVAVLGVKPPVSSNRLTGNIRRKVDQVSRARIPNIEENLLPLPARFKDGEPIIRAPLAGSEYARPALHYGFRKREFWILNRIDPEVIELSRGFDGRPEADESFHKRNKRREIENCVAGKMMGLKLVEVKKAP
jgi:hypothetical protein